MYTLKPYPGKFEANGSQLLAKIVYTRSLDGTGEGLGEVETFGYWAFVQGKRYGFILNEDSQGFVFVEVYPLIEAMKQWKDVEYEYEEFCKQTNEE